MIELISGNPVHLGVAILLALLLITLVLRISKFLCVLAVLALAAIFGLPEVLPIAWI